MEIVGNSAHFLTTFLSRPASSIPKGAQWAVFFHDLERKILPAVTLSYSHEPGGNNEWKTERSARAVLAKEYQKTKGCLFCHAIGIPGESMTTTNEGIKSNAFIRGIVGAGRSDFEPLRITFLDTQISFADSFLRGWALATANFGLVARSPSSQKNYRTDLTCYKFGIKPEGPTITQTYTFKDICCISIQEEEYSYNVPQGYIKREAKFIYNTYSVDTDTSNSFL